MAGIRRLRRPRTTKNFSLTIEYRGLAPGSPSSIALAAAVGRLRSAASIPLVGDALVEFWGSERMWAHRFAESLWLYYKPDPSGDDEFVDLMAVHNHLHQQ